jgi:hypothetical protein
VHILLLVFTRVLAGFKLVGDEYGAALATHTYSWMKIAETVEASAPQSSFLGRFPPGECRRITILPVRRGTLRKLP